MWLKLNYKQEEFEYEIFKPNTIFVSVVKNKIAPINSDDKSIRLSKIFPLCYSDKLVKVKTSWIYFFDFNNPFRVLGLIKQRASKELIESTFFSNGLCSVILITESKNLVNELYNLISENPNSKEIWEITNSLISDIEISLPKIQEFKYEPLNDYSDLSIVERSILDEFATSIKILFSKILLHDNDNISTLHGLIKIINSFIHELNYLTKLEGEIPDLLKIYSYEFLSDPVENNIFKQQIIDRLIQINSSLSYFSTQSYSGAVPILERRSLIRRNSLLGIGISIRALNRIIKSIEKTFSSVNFVEIITNIMDQPIAQPLNGLDNLPLYNRNEWYKSNIEKIPCEKTNDNQIEKLAYFSSRLGFRETEFSITAAINSLPAGLELEWSLLTITHEMLHSHVRILINSIFYGKEKLSDEANYLAFFSKYSKKLKNELLDEYNLLDSIRSIIINYCLGTKNFGSLTESIEYTSVLTNEGVPFSLPNFNHFHQLFQNEIRNINEVFVHILDFYYFYGGRSSKYIPLIWYSWSSVPHVSADIRQYILRSLLVVASTIDQDPTERWTLSLKKFSDIINKEKEAKKNAIFNKVSSIIENKKLLDDYYYNAFKNSLILVDLAKDIFYSKKIASKLWDDDNISKNPGENDVEIEITYDLPVDFINEVIDSPVAYLFDRMIKVLKNQIEDYDVERITALCFLAMNSKK
jgi:hypothetical protein